MGLTNAAIDKRIGQFTSDLQRAHDLYATLVCDGYTVRDGSEWATRLRQPDRRDVAQFIFFEIAAKYESLARDLFQVEVRIRLVDSPQRAEHVMGSIDRGLQGVMGWASPKQVSRRAVNLFGKQGFFARLQTRLGDTTYQRLMLAHKIRNRIAHSGTSDYTQALATLAVPKRSRKGCGPGRVLIDYPASAGVDDRWFHRFMNAYESFASTAARQLRANE